MSKAIGLEVNPEKTKYMIMSRDQNIVRNGNIKIGDLSFEGVEKFKYLGATVTNINDTREEIKRRINMGNECYYSIEKLLSSSLLSKNLKVRIYKTVILPVVLYGCETWTLTLREEHRLRVFENKVLRKIFGAKRNEVTGEWRKLHNAELHALYSSPDIIRNIKSRRLRWAGHVARDNAGEMSPGSSTESYPAFARIGLRENPGKNLNQITCPDRDSNPGHLVSQPDALTVTPQVWTEKNSLRRRGSNPGPWFYVPSALTTELRQIQSTAPDQATKGNIEGGRFDLVLWIEFGVAQWSERLDVSEVVLQTFRDDGEGHMYQFEIRNHGPEMTESKVISKNSCVEMEFHVYGKVKEPTDILASTPLLQHHQKYSVLCNYICLTLIYQLQTPLNKIPAKFLSDADVLIKTTFKGIFQLLTDTPDNMLYADRKYKGLGSSFAAYQCMSELTTIPKYPCKRCRNLSNEIGICLNKLGLQNISSDSFQVKKLRRQLRERAF
ncbi:hypothetical protein ANN_05763 [Periplaneta americana]|uniref:Uncharacterized protein n=1 Tax=Periplaneta americana TaxID=6978 RepID=A0ABQ8TDI1_PERAM|nr:hypothetical protein ANN_05763 [Periplaneta americana]